MSRWIGALVDRRRAVLLLAALVALALVPGALRLESDNSPAVYHPRTGAEAERYRAFVARFGAADGVRLVVAGERLWSGEGLAALAALEERAAALPGVVSASSIVRRHRAELGEFPPDDPLAWRAELLADPFDRGMGWLARDGSAASVLVEIAPLAAREYAALEDRLRELAKSTGAGLEVTVVGTRSLERALDRAARAIGTRYLPALLGFALVLLALVFRDARGVATPLVFVLFCASVVLGAMGWSGVRVHLVLAILPPVAFAVALASAVHLTIRCRALAAGGLAPRAAVVATYAEKGRAVLFAAAAIAGGFAALATSGVAPVAELGLWAAGALGVQLLAAFTLLPALLTSSAGGSGGLAERALETRLEIVGRAGARGAARRRAALVAGALALLALALAGLPRLGAESDLARAFSPEHLVRRALDRAEALEMGVSTVELELLAGSEDEGFDSPAALALLAELVAELATTPGVLSAASAAELAASVGAASPWAPLATPEELRAQALALLAADEEGSAVLARFLTPDGRGARVALFVRTAGFDAIDPLAAAAERAARARFPAADVAATGSLPLLLGFHRELLATLVSSLALALPYLLGLFWLVLRRLRWAALALLPNLWPVLLLLGGMGWAGARLDLATVMVASIVLGLAVENTMHTLANHARDSAELGSQAAAVVARLERAAPAYFLTGTILIAGFGVCGLSDFAPIARFGQLSAAALALALVCDLLLVPALFGSRRSQ
jgi:uncharacterized protein